MNREIKFRIWSNKEKEFINNWAFVSLGIYKAANLDEIIRPTPQRNILTQIDYKFETYGHGNRGMTPKLKTFYDSIVELEDCVLEQYTGLKDKNGKEIYEGDIVDVDCLYHRPGQAPWRASIIWYGTKWGLTYKPTPQDIHIWRNKMVVIGNIHENPELLNENGQKT